MDFQILKVAEVGQADIARWLGVSKVAVCHWVKGTSNVDPLRVAKVEKLLAAVARAVEAGDMPVPKIPRGDRAERLTSALVKHLKKPS